MIQENLIKYAELAVKVGVNLQPNQPLVMNAPITAAPFVREVAKIAYSIGAKYVHTEWNDEKLSKITLEDASEASLESVRDWKVRGMEEMAEEGAAFLSIVASNPDLLKDVDQNRVAIANKAQAKAMQKYRKYTQTAKVSWAIVSVPSEEWAAKLYPGLSTETQVHALWENIFAVTRINEEDPVAAWNKHIESLQQKLHVLNTKKYKKLHYQAPGTDLTIELPLEQVWLGGGLNNEEGTYFVPNLPTEEVFTLPVKTGVNGVVSSTKPLNLNGNLVENFSFTFKDGKVTEFQAEQGYDVLKKLLETDEGSLYLGEVALVPNSSPVSKQDVIFYNTLFDENASCHLALGSAYPICLEGGAALSKEELEAKGVNTSMIHVDFMIGSEELNITAETKDGTKEAIFVNGEWAI
ncbi:Aminopeptidase 2 [Bacillus sp. THAF10]|uniref:aminopeptidase n=1 Tax=Bacillus sp. THAF10 TaxID=2587848 RepID=UPI0012690FA4|nr:aminopeptidase [Bacillus sp. THAF10]QFT89786.1 Aminopeptidase 2 [Bacillus sp. THAF10]